MLPWNYPHWSICYEFFYYLLFGAFAFLQGKSRIPLICGIMLLAGPSIVILLPAWAVGAAIIYNRSIRIESVRVGALVFIFTLLTVLAFSSSGLHKEVKSYMQNTVSGWWRLGFSQSFLTDYAIAALVVLHFCAARACGAILEPVMNLLKPYITFIASFAFTIYLFHRPITLFLSQAGFKADTKTEFTFMLLGILVVLYFLSKTGEIHRETVKSFLSRLTLVQNKNALFVSNQDVTNKTKDI